MTAQTQEQTQTGPPDISEVRHIVIRPPEGDGKTGLCGYLTTGNIVGWKGQKICPMCAEVAETKYGFRVRG